MEDYIIYVNDTETTGLDYKIHDIIELSMSRFCFTPGIIEPEQKTWYIKPLNFASIDDGALKVNGHKREDITWLTAEGKAKYREAKDVIVEVEQWMMEDGVSSVDRVFCGHNPGFDIDFTKSFWTKLNSIETYPFAVEKDDRVLDTKMVALLIDICTGKRRQYYNLSSVVEFLKVKKGKAHQASEDVRMTKDCLLTAVSPMIEIIKEKFKDNYK